MLIDSHQHFWRIGKYGHEWPTPDLAPIHRDFGVDDLLQDSSTTRLAGTVVVQSQPSDADTDWLLQLASQHQLIKGIVGWVDFEAPNAASRLTQLARHPKFKSVRPMLQSLPDDNYILRDSVLSALNAVIELNLRFDALVFTRHLASIAVLAHRWPQLRIVIDHAAKPPIAQKSVQATQQWQIAMSRVAEFPNVHCKLSGLFTEMEADQSRDDAIPYVEHVLKMFGAERVMWGSDWPVLKLRNSYSQWHEWVMKRIAHLDAPQQAAIMGGNAIRFYGLAG
jgi:L-fuconolactonase